MKVSLLVPAYPLDNQQVAITSCRLTAGHPQIPWQLTLCQLLGIGATEANCLPYAQIDRACNKALQKILPAGNVIRADPVHLRPDRDNATLIPAEQLSLKSDVVDSMLDTLNDFYVQDGLSFHRDTPERWYLCSNDDSDLFTYPPSFLAHRNASAYLPDGDNLAHWRRLQTEIQMILHSHPANQERERQGLMPVNCVWFWGGGDLSGVSRQESVDEIALYCDGDDFVSALADQIEVTISPLNSLVESLQVKGHSSTVSHHVVVDTRIMQSWLAAERQVMEHEIARVDETLLQPLLNVISHGTLKEIKIFGEDGVIATADASMFSGKLSESARSSSSWVRWFKKFVS